jgi:hypothetical protein
MLQALTISLPVFAVVGLGALLRRGGLLNDAAHAFLSRFVYLFCLPILIFLGIAGHDFRALLNLPVIAGSLLASAAVAALAWAAGARLPRPLRAPVATGAYLANLTYLGFPLAKSAFGADGLVYAGVINAFTMPVFVAGGVGLLALGRPGHGSLSRHLRTAFLNPILAATVLGLAVSFALHEAGLAARAGHHPLALAATDIVLGALRMVGDMGLGLSLLAVGAALRFRGGHGRVGLMLLTSAAKLVAVPLLTLLLCRWLFPDMPRAALGTAVLLMACPVSVGLYVISEQMGADSEFLAGTLVLSTAAAVVTIPAWLLVLL